MTGYRLPVQLQFPAIRRIDHRRSRNLSIASIIAILSRFAIVHLLPRGAPRKSLHSKSSFLMMAGFQAPLRGWFGRPLTVMHRPRLACPPSPGLGFTLWLRLGRAVSRPRLTRFQNMDGPFECLSASVDVTDEGRC